MSDQNPHGSLAVEIESGFFAGIVTDGVRSWRGIPFAAPPLGPMRFRAPQPAAPWQDIRAANADISLRKIPTLALYDGGTGSIADCSSTRRWS